MADPQPPSSADAIKIALSILEPFRDSSLYDYYQAEDGWTDDQFQMALNVLNAASVRGELGHDPCFTVDAAKRNPGIRAH